MQRREIIFFVKYPQIGKVKTRLAVNVGEKKAYDIYQLLLENSWNTIKQSKLLTSIEYTPEGFRSEIKNLFGDNIEYHAQQGNDIGMRMATAFQRVFASGTDYAILMGSDLPDLDEEIIKIAFTKLKNHEVVIGPASDGGYYLIGFQRGYFTRKIFKGIKWSSDQVYSQTFKKICDLNLSMYVLPERNDIDTFDDVKLFLNENKEISEFKESLSKIIFGGKS